MTSIFKLHPRVLACFMIGVVLPVGAQAQRDGMEPPPQTGWRVTAGPQWRQVGRLRWNPGVSHGLVLLNGSTTFSGLPPGVYDNGFVLPDNLNNGVTTSNFGWDASTVVSVTQGEGFEFELLKTNVTTTTVVNLVANQEGPQTDRPNGPGFFLKAETPALWQRGGWDVSMELGYSLTGMNLSQLHAAFAGLVTQTIQTTTIDDLYGGSDFGVTPGPGSTYTGSPAGGPVIPLAPIASFPNTVEVQRAVVVDSVYNRSFGLDLHTLSLGPRVYYESADRRCQVGVSTGLALNLACWNASVTEALWGAGGVLGARSHRSSGCKVLPGFYLEAHAAAQLSETWYAMVAARYDWAGTLRGGEGPTAFSVNLSGWTLMTGLTHMY